MEDLKDGQDIGQDTAPETGKDSTGNTDGWNPDENKPYMRQLGKKYWGNEKLRQFNSLNEVIDDYMKADQKDVPEKYDIGEGADNYVDTFRRLGLSNDAAKEVMGLINGVRPKEIDTDGVLREMHGDSVSKVKESAERAMKTFADEGITKMAEEYGLMKNPAFIEFADRIGKAVGDDFHDFRKDSGNKGNNSRSYFLDMARQSLGL